MSVLLSEPLVNEQRAAELLGLSPGTLAIWRCRRTVQIPYVKIGKAVRYRLDDLQQYIRERTVGGEETAR